ncbi:unnamed protein product [Knipowitschia caucasica]
MSSGRGIDYSAWDHIYVSDDEDVSSPFVDTASLYRMRHRTRLERTSELEQREKDLRRNMSECKRRINQAQDRLKELGDESQVQDRLKELGDESQDQGRLGELGDSRANSSTQSQDIHRELAELRAHLKGFEAMLEVHEREKRRQPWNVDTISKQGFSKSVVNTRTDAPEEKPEEGISFGDKYDKEIRHFGLLRRWEDSQSYLSERPHLVCEETASALVHICISMEREQKQALMGQVAHQAIVMKFILDLAQGLKVDPRGCFRLFFSRIKTADQLYLDAFDQELELLKQRVRSSAQSLTKEEEEEDEEERPRLGPGGLDPREVYTSLPQEMQRGFDEKNVEILQRAMDTLHPEEAKFHLRRCIESGLWVPD